MDTPFDVELAFGLAQQPTFGTLADSAGGRHERGSGPGKSVVVVDAMPRATDAEEPGSVEELVE